MEWWAKAFLGESMSWDGRQEYVFVEYEMFPACAALLMFQRRNSSVFKDDFRPILHEGSVRGSCT